MENEIINQLKKLKSIEPNEAFWQRSKSLILIQRPAPVFSVKYWFSAPVLNLAAVFAVLVVFVVGLNFYFSTDAAKVLATTSLDAQSLSREFQELNINIQLEEVKYEQGVNQTITSALTEIGSNSIKHLNPALLESEQKNFSSDDLNGEQIDKLLDQLIN